MGTGLERIEPIPGAPAAVVETGAGDTTTDGALATDERPRNEGRALVVADYHAGLEVGLRREGVSLPSRAADRRESLLALLDGTGAGCVVFLGDLAHSIGDSRGAEREELEHLFEAITERASAVVVKGNHDGGIEGVAKGFEEVSVTPPQGTRIDDLGFAHGHTWPDSDVVRASVCCIAHEHPTVRLTDSVGGRRVERVWLRGHLDYHPFDAHERDSASSGPKAMTDDSAERTIGTDEGSEGGELVVFPAFNDLVGGTWVNVSEQGFLSPFLPEGLSDGEAYLLDGTRLGDYRRV